jgi:hypothetical protein
VAATTSVADVAMPDSYTKLLGFLTDRLSSYTVKLQENAALAMKLQSLSPEERARFLPVMAEATSESIRYRAYADELTAIIEAVKHYRDA